MKRISKQTKAIADAHILARQTGKFDDPVAKTKEDVFEYLRNGKTFSEVMRQIEVRYCTFGSIMLSDIMHHQSTNYRNNIYKGFKTLLD